MLLFFLLFSASTAALDGLTANELGFLQGLSARDIRELGELCGIRDAALLQYHDLAARLSSPNEHTPLLREALSELGHSVLPHEQTSRAAVDSTVGGGIPPFETPADCRRTFQHLQTFAYYGPCVQAWDPHANFSTGSGVAIPPPPNSSKTAHRFRCKPTAQDERKAECGFSGSESDWTYDPLREGQHQLTFYPYVSAQKFSFSGQGLERAELGRTEMFSASVVTAACPAHWVLKGRLVGPSIVPIRCVRADSQTWNCSYAVSEAGEYRVEIVLHPHGNVAFFHGSPIRGPSQHCHKRATIRPRAHEQCEKGDAWAAAPLFAAEYILNRTGLLASSASSSSASASESPSAFRQTPLCARGNHAGRWLRLRSVAHVTVLNGSAFSGSNLDFVLDSVGLNRGWIWAPYECHYHFYTPAEFQACMSDEHRRITVDVEGDSLNREVLDSLAQLLDVSVVTNGQLIKPHKSFSYGETLHWAAYDSVRYPLQTPLRATLQLFPFHLPSFSVSHFHPSSHLTLRVLLPSHPTGAAHHRPGPKSAAGRAELFCYRGSVAGAFLVGPSAVVAPYQVTDRVACMLSP